MASGICYTWSGDKKIYESILGPKLGVYREGGNFGPITTDTFTLSLMPSNEMCRYTIMVKGDDYILSENNPTDYLVVRYGGVDKMFGYEKKDKVTTITFKLSTINSSGYINISCSTSNPLETSVTCIIERIAGNGIKRNYSLLYEKSNKYGGYQEFNVTEKPSIGDVYTIKSVYPTESENFKYEGYFLGITVTY